MGVNSPLTAELLCRISGPFESTYCLARYIIGTLLPFPSWSVMLWASTAPRPGQKGPASEASGHQVRSPRGSPLLNHSRDPEFPPHEPMLASRPLLQDHPPGGRLPWEHTPIPKESRQTLATRLGRLLTCVQAPSKCSVGQESAFSTMTHSDEERSSEGVREISVERDLSGLYGGVHKDRRVAYHLFHGLLALVPSPTNVRSKPASDMQEFFHPDSLPPNTNKKSI